jgi:RNA polymerase sigma-70 factor (ECF subfamily)
MSSLRLVVPSTSKAATDAELVARALAGSEASAEALFRRHHGMVTGLSFRLLGNDAEVDDVVQEAFLEAFRLLEALENPQAFASWIAGIVVRIIGKRLRRRKLLERLGLRRHEPVDVERFLSTSCPADVASELSAVYRVLGDLPADARVILVLHRVEGLTIQETAERMRLSPATVKRRLAEAHAHLYSVCGEAP